MGMKKKADLPGIPAIPEVPAILALPTAVKAVEQKEKAGDDRILAKPYNRDLSISVDAIHKSSLESPTLANLSIGRSEKEVLELTEKFVRFNIELNKKLKAE